MRQGEGNAISVNGGRPEGNNYTLDGLVNTDPALVTPAVILSQDAIQEFKVESGTYPAEYGFSRQPDQHRQQGRHQQAPRRGLRSQPQQCFRCHAVSDRRTASSPAPPRPRTRFCTRTSSASSRAVRSIIPKLYDGRNKTFWMANYEGWRINNGGVAYETRSQPGGPHWRLLGRNLRRRHRPALPGGPLPAYGTAECSTLLDNGYNCMPVESGYRAMPSAGNRFHRARFRSAASAWSPLPTNSGQTPTIANQPEGVTNFIQDIPGPCCTRTSRPTAATRTSANSVRSSAATPTPTTSTSSLYNSGSLDYGIENIFENRRKPGQSRTPSTSAQSNVNNFRFGYLRANAPEGSATPPSTWLGHLAETGIFTTLRCPAGDLAQCGPVGSYASGGGPVNSYSGSDSPDMGVCRFVHHRFKGRHTLGFGVDYRHWHLIRNLDDDFYGDWSFQRRPSAATTASSPGGNPIQLPASQAALPDGVHSTLRHGQRRRRHAARLLPRRRRLCARPLEPDHTGRQPADHVFNYFAPVLRRRLEGHPEADPQPRPSLGLSRRDLRSSNHFFWLDTKNANGGLCYADPKLSSRRSGARRRRQQRAHPALLRQRAASRAPKTPFAPRFGVNYRLTDKTVVRGGYGIFFDSVRRPRDRRLGGHLSVQHPQQPQPHDRSTRIPKLSNSMFPALQHPGTVPGVDAVVHRGDRIGEPAQSLRPVLDRFGGARTGKEHHPRGELHRHPRRHISSTGTTSLNRLPFLGRV